MVNYRAKDDNAETLHNKLAEIRTNHSASTTKSDLDDFKKLVAAMWKLLKEKGCTDEDLNRASLKVDKLLRISPDQLNKPIYCPKCDRRMQRVDSIKCSCPYCRYVVFRHNYSAYDAIADGVEDEPVIQPDALPEEKPYDLDADLNFDDLL